MAVKVRIPTPLRQLTGGAATVQVEGATVEELLGALDQRYDGFRRRLCDDQGNLRRFVSVFLNTEDIRNLDQLQTAVREGDELSIIPAIAGG
jgi:molybdopterin synthase sulfur carrier subunit